MPTSNPSRTVRATVIDPTTVTPPQAAYTFGSQALVVIDGSDQWVTLQDYAAYRPTVGDRLLVQAVNNVLEIVQFISAGTAPNTDPLAALIAQNGQALDAFEDPSNPGNPLVTPSVSITTGLVWHDLTASTYYVYNGTAWIEPTDLTTLALCASTRVSQVGANQLNNVTLYGVQDPLSTSITSASYIYDSPAVTSTVPPVVNPATGQFFTGDVAFQSDTLTWWVFDIDPSAATGTWADWGRVVYPSTLALIAALAQTNIVSNISTMVNQIANDIATGNTQNLPSDLEQFANDILTAGSLSYQALNIGLGQLAVALDAGLTSTDNEIVVITGSDTIETTSITNLALELLADEDDASAQTTLGVAGVLYTGSPTDISSANFLSDYQVARQGT